MFFSIYLLLSGSRNFFSKSVSTSVFAGTTSGFGSGIANRLFLEDPFLWGYVLFALRRGIKG